MALAKDQSKALFENSPSAGSNAGTVAGIKAGIDERVPNNHTGFATILSLPDGTQWLGLGRNKKSAQHDAAAKCLKETKNIFVPLPEGAGLQTVGGTPGRDQTNIFQYIDKVGSILLMVVVSMLPHAEIGGNDHREDAPQFNFFNVSPPRI